MPACDVSVFDPLFEGSALDSFKAAVMEQNAQGFAVRHVERRREVVVDVSFPEPRATPVETAVITWCAADGAVVVKPGAAPDGSDIIINDAYSSTRHTSTFQRAAAGRWLMLSDTTGDETIGGDTCPAT